MTMDHIVKSNWAAGLPQNTKQTRKKTPKWLIWAPRLLNLCGWRGATSPGRRGTCQPLQAPSWHGVPCPCACPLSLGQSRPSGLDELQMPKRESRTRVTLFPKHCPGCQSSQHCFHPKLSYGRRVTIIHFLTFKKIRVEIQGEERGRVPSNDMGTEACREWGGGEQPMNLMGWMTTFSVLPIAEGLWHAEPSSLLRGDNSSSGVIKTGPDHKSEWIKALGKGRDKRYENFT